MNRFLPTTLLWLALCMSAQAQPQCPQTPAPGTSNAMCASTAFVTKGLTNADAGNLTTGILPPGRTDGHMDGTATNDSAAAGEVGEFINGGAGSSPGTGIALTTGIPLSLASISLTVGDWDLFAGVQFDFAATTNITMLQASQSSADNVLQTGIRAYAGMVFAPFVPGANTISLRTGYQRASITTPTTFYIVAQADFTISTLSARAFIQARRIR